LLGAFCLFFIAGLGIGAALGAISPFMPSIKQLSGQVFGRPLFFTSGVFFTAEQLPESARDILLYNPLLHFSEMSRSAFFKSFDSAYIDLSYAGLFAMLVLVFGLMMHQALHKRALGLL
jgi:capsular polysaccharide transport system permease protein